MIAGYCWPQSVLPGEAVSVAVSSTRQEKITGSGPQPDTATKEIVAMKYSTVTEENRR